jgi:uncharacterized protein (UPF0210 family)
MKKVISVLVIMAVFSTTLFAAPLSLTGSTDQQSRETYQSEFAFKAEVLEDDLFAEVQAVALTPEEAQAVEGEGLISCIVSAVVSTAIVVTDLYNGDTNAASDHLMSGIISTAFATALIPY